jgi:hypothetical protein
MIKRAASIFSTSESVLSAEHSIGRRSYHVFVVESAHARRIFAAVGYGNSIRTGF